MWWPRWTIQKAGVQSPTCSPNPPTATARSLKNDGCSTWPAGHRQRGSAGPDQRRRVRPPAGAPLLPGAKDLRRRGNRGTERADCGRLRRGITLDDGPVRPSSVRSSPAPATRPSQDHVAGGSESHRARYDGSGWPSGPPADADRIGPVRLGNLKVGVPRVDPRGARRVAGSTGG